MLDKPGVYFIHWQGEVEVSRAYWKHVGGGQNETLDQRYLRRRKNEFYDLLDDIFEVNGCGVIPEDLVGSLQFLIDIRGDDKDVLVVVPTKATTIVHVALSFDEAAGHNYVQGAGETATVGGDNVVATSGDNDDEVVDDSDEDSYDRIF